MFFSSQETIKTSDPKGVKQLADSIMTYVSTMMGADGGGSAGGGSAEEGRAPPPEGEERVPAVAGLGYSAAHPAEYATKWARWGVRFGRAGEYQGNSSQRKREHRGRAEDPTTGADLCKQPAPLPRTPPRKPSPTPNNHFSGMRARLQKELTSFQREDSHQNHILPTGRLPPESNGKTPTRTSE